MHSELVERDRQGQDDFPLASYPKLEKGEVTPGETSWAADKEHMKAAGMEKGEAPELGVHHESVECQVPLPFLTPSPFIGLSQAKGLFLPDGKVLEGK